MRITAMICGLSLLSCAAVPALANDSVIKAVKNPKNWAMQQGEYPTPYYRMVTKESGLLWSDVVGRGSAWCKAEGLRRWRPYLVPSAS